MNNTDKQYIELVERILTEGKSHSDRTNVGTLRVWTHLMNFDLNEGLPIITVKKAGIKNTIAELLFFLSGSTNLQDLKTIYPPSVKWWVDFADENFDLGPMYGRQFRQFNGDSSPYADQINSVISDIISNPNSRRLLFTSYNPLEARKGALYPCHSIAVQFQVQDGFLNCSTLSRSIDTMLGLPHNILSAAIFTHMVAHVCNLKPGILGFIGNDFHIYNNHIEGAKEVLRRGREEQMYQLPTLKLNPAIKNIDDFTMDDIKVENYQSHPAIPLPIAI